MENDQVKDIEFLGASLRDIRDFPDDARKIAGQELLNGQYGGCLLYTSRCV